ncbi:MAG: exopolysaccharide biosynthesis polyprenyl glycosylphosphotransferase [Oscillospiraceae bacterium]|nr:exopolysaccharide biosynthesis polyprenyl glycosylphosphotransferase [Oscillospiraceae bacterium]
MVRSKSRNLNNEHLYFMIGNTVAVIVILVIATVLLPECGSIGRRNMVFLNMGNGALIMMFMHFMDKYRELDCSLYEKAVITVLSVLYSFAVLCIINPIFFRESKKLIADAAVAAADIVSVISADAVMGYIFDRKPRPSLLVIDIDGKNFYRTKKIKYGVGRDYDARYENLRLKDTDAFDEFIELSFPVYDAVCVFDSMPEELYRAAVNAANQYNKDLFIVPEIIDVGKLNAKVIHFDDILTLYIRNKSLNFFVAFVKRAMDIVIASVGIAAACIPMALIAAAVKLSSPGPVFYKQKRLTGNKKEFDIYKFRTMVPDAEKLTGPKIAVKDDPRITPVGKILRSYRLDELPQFINVLKGDMSIVGPRPERPFFVERFSKEVEGYDQRFKMKAGITGLSHVYGKYATHIWDRTYYDLYYITHYSLLLDLKIILLTTKTVFLKSTAEGEDEYKQDTSSHSDTEANIH